MKKLLIGFILILATIQLHAQSEPWIRITPTPTESSLKDVIDIPGTNRIMAIGSGATLLYTDDNGENWYIKHKPAGISRFVSLTAIHFADSDIGYIVGNNATILKTTNGGNDWVNISQQGDHSILDVYFLSESTGIITLNESVLKTINGGQTWDTIAINGNLNNPKHLHFINESVGYFANEWGPGYFKTVDAGNNWEDFYIDSIIENISVTSIRFLDDDIGFLGAVSNYMHYIFKTINGGLDWYEVSNHGTIGSRTIFFINDSLGFSVGQEYYWNRILRTEDGGEYWEEANTDNNALYLNSFGFSNINNGFCVGDRGFILRTQDLGKNWIRLNDYSIRAGSINVSQVVNDSIIYIGTTDYGGGVIGGNVYRSFNAGESWEKILTQNNVSDLQFNENSNVGWVCCDVFYGEIYKTINNGSTWQTITIQPWDFTTKCLYFINENTGFVGGEEGSAVIYKTTDGGINWEKHNIPLLESISSITFADDSNGFACATEDYGRLARTNDQGNTWQVEEVDMTTYFNKVKFTTNNTGYIIGRNTILKTIDGGDTWVEKPSCLDGFADFTDICFPYEDIGYITVADDEVATIKSIDGGETWFAIDYPTTSTPTTVGFFNESEGLFMGSGGTIFKTYTGGVVNIPEFPKIIDETKITLCYPNPATNKIALKLDFDQKDYPFKVAIYNNIGKILRSKEIHIIHNETNINTNNFEPGIYYVVISKHGKQIACDKFIKM